MVKIDKKQEFSHKSYYDYYKKNINDNTRYESFKSLYKDIKKDYTQLLDKGEINLHLEKIRIEANMSKRGGSSSSLLFCIITIVLTTMANGIISALGYINSAYKICFIVIISVALALYIMLTFRSTIIEQQKGDYLYTVCLNVIEDIEKSSRKENICGWDIRQEIVATKEQRSNKENKHKKRRK